MRLYENEILKRLLFWALVIFTVGYVFMPTFLHKNLYYVGILLPFLLAYPLRDIGREVAKSRLFLLSVVYIAYMVLATFWGTGLEWSDHFRISRHALTLLGFLLVVYALLGREGKNGEAFFRYAIPLSCLAGIGLMVWFYFLIDVKPQPNYPTRLHSPYQIGHPIQGATLFGFLFLVTYFQFFNRKGSGYREKLFWLGAMIVEMGFVLLTQSRGPLLAVLGGLFIGGIITRDYKVLLPASLVVLGGVALVTAGIFTPFARGDAGRFRIWKEAWEMVRGEWIWGRGFLGDDSVIHASWGKMYHAHNLFINHLVDGGAIALLLVSALMIYGFRLAFLQYRQWGEVTLLVLFSYLFLAFLTDGADLVDSPSYLWPAFWIPVGLAISFELSLRRKRPEECREHSHAGLLSPASDHS